VKADKYVSVDVLRTFLEQIKELAKIPQNLVLMSVHGRIILRGDQGECRPLFDKKEGGRMGRPSGENSYGRGGGRGQRGGYNNRHDDPRKGGGGRGGRSDFNTRQPPAPEPVYDD